MTATHPCPEKPKRVRQSFTFLCPTCGCNTTTIDVRPAPNESIRRRRKCLECKFRFTTYERLGQSPPQDWNI
jgi:C4-type Zn-finger protein